MKTLKKHLENLSTDELYNLSRFVVSENYKQHSKPKLKDKYAADIQSVFEEEILYMKNAKVFVCKDYYGNILGSIRILKWNTIDILPLQKIFNINPLTDIDHISSKNIWHIGRFAIKKEVHDINLFKQLMVCAIAPICKNKKNVAFAECDNKLLRILTLLGIKASIIGKKINYLGSETIPIRMDYNGLINFYNKNKTLIPKNILTPIA